MTHSDAVLQFGANAYGKPATALNILRETVLGREIFDHAFKTYTQRWKFKRPTPADLFRTMEDASGQDLDWFWRGWFYTTDHVDLSIENVRIFQPNGGDPRAEAAIRERQRIETPRTLSQQRNEALPKRIEEFPSLRDRFNEPESHQPTPQEIGQYEAFLATLTEQERQLLATNYYLYVVDVRNIGGLVMPLIFRVEYTDGTSEEIRVPAEIWRYNNFNVSKLIVSKKELKSIVLDPNLETADTDLDNNAFPRRPITTRFPIVRPTP
ncbi:MAG: M1 family aminopeptidase [Pyrinomonadaceae bacterium]